MSISQIKPWLQIHSADNVGVVISSEGLAQSTEIQSSESSFSLLAKIPRGHKFSLQDIPKGSPIMKFGHVIGIATQDIQRGTHVHTQNVDMPPADLLQESLEVNKKHQREWNHLPNTFRGYSRKSGLAGTRNYIVVTSSVNCSATVVKAVCRHFLNRDLGRIDIDGIIPVTHSQGCAQAIGGIGYQVLNHTLAGWVFHPNVVGAVIIGLGCEGTTAASILLNRRAHQLDCETPIESFAVQNVGGTAEAIKEGIERVKTLLRNIPQMERQDLPVSHLNMGLNCGGSDGFSGLTANPALGVTSDILVSKGGSVALAEIPECHGAEALLYNRSVNTVEKEKLKKIFDWWLDYSEQHHVSLNNNVAPGNKAGGITTIIEKSLGAVAKAGTSPLTQAADYSEPMTQKGFIIMNTPGMDPVSVTGLVAGGSNLVAFTTGRGSVYGCSIAPTIKIATNSDLFRRMSGDMDINAGVAIEDSSVEEVGEYIYRFAIEVASGKKSFSEQLGLGWEEFTPWVVGETL